MSNIRDFQATWSTYRKRVVAAVEKRDKELARLAKYEGKRAEEERETAKAKFNEAVEVARNEAQGRFREVLGRMADKAESIEALAVPSEDAMKVLQLLALRDRISPKEAEDAARLCEGDDGALSTLEQILTMRGGFALSSVHVLKGKRGQAMDALKEFERAASMVLQWSGGTRGELMRRRAEEYTSHAGVRTPTAAAIAADVNAECPEYDFTKQIIGGHATYDGARSLD